ncbi:hypothetical protein HDU98_004037, partial [Podochytrium sp. JEL0797]
MAEFNGTVGYSSTCTIKTGAFGGTATLDYLGKSRKHNTSSFVFGVGSDDRRAYVWEVPPKEFLLSRREEVDAVVDFGRRRRFEEDRVAFVGDNGVKKVPFEVSEEAFSVGVHRSIVNSILFHPKIPLVVTAGVEKICRVFSPFPFRDFDDVQDNKTDTIPRDNFGYRSQPIMGLSGALREDIRTLIVFDRLIERESQRNTLWNDSEDIPGSDDSDSEDGSSADDDENGSWETTSGEGGSELEWETADEDASEDSFDLVDIEEDGATGVVGEE